MSYWEFRVGDISPHSFILGWAFHRPCKPPFSWFTWVKGKKQSRMTKNYVCCASYLRNHTSYVCHLWCKCVKWLYFQVFFSILKFWFSRLSRGWKDKKWPKKSKISFGCTLYFRKHMSYDLHLWYTCMYKKIHLWYTWMHKKIISPGIFFIFFKILIFGIIRGKRGGKRAKNGSRWENILSVSLHISGTIHHMIVIFDAHVKNDDISSIFFHFSKFWILWF